MKRTQVLFLLLITLLLLAFTGCTQEPAEEEVEALAPDAYSISLEPIGHWHVFSPKTLLFTVTDTATDQGVAGLDFTVQIARAESDSVSERTVADGDVADEGDGVYALEYTPSSIGAYSVAAAFVQNGQHFASAPTAFEVAKAGEEGIRASVDGTDYVYQIRYHFEPGHVHANDNEPVSIVFELMRGVETGDDINWEQPWTNTFVRRFCRSLLWLIAFLIALMAFSHRLSSVAPGGRAQIAKVSSQSVDMLGQVGSGYVRPGGVEVTSGRPPFQEASQLLLQPLPRCPSGAGLLQVVAANAMSGRPFPSNKRLLLTR